MVQREGVGAKRLCADAAMALHHTGGFSRDSSEDSAHLFSVPNDNHLTPSDVP